MATQFVLKPNEVSGFDVYVRDLVSHEEYSARYNHLVGECGFTPDEAARELYFMVGSFRRTNDASVGCARGTCEALIFDYIDPGDILLLEGFCFVVNAPGFA